MRPSSGTSCGDGSSSRLPRSHSLQLPSSHCPTSPHSKRHSRQQHLGPHPPKPPPIPQVQRSRNRQLPRRRLHQLRPPRCKKPLPLSLHLSRRIKHPNPRERLNPNLSQRRSSGKNQSQSPPHQRSLPRSHNRPQNQNLSQSPPRQRSLPRSHSLPLNHQHRNPRRHRST